MEPQMNKLNSVKILIAEDSRTQAEQLRFLLEQNGYQVTVTTNGKQALQTAMEQKPALVISDIVMPEMDGYELCKAIKSDATLKEIPVILVTSLSDSQDVIRGLECGADNFIIKPYNETHLLSCVQFMLLNNELRETDRLGMDIKILFNGQQHFITSDRLQILNLLLSTYEAAIQRNKELNQALLSLSEGEQHLQTILNSALDAVISMDKQGLVIDWNPEAERMFGYSRDDALGKPLANLIIPPIAREAHWQGLERFLKTGEGPMLGKRVEVTAIRADGCEFPIEEAIVAIRNENTVFFNAFLRDITERKQAAEQLHDNAVRLQTIFDTVVDSIITINDHGIIETVNPATEDIFGYAATEMIGRNVDMLIPESYRSEHDGFLERYRTTGEAHIIGIGREVMGQRKDGRTFPLELAVSEMRLGEGRYFIGIARDITARKQTEFQSIVARNEAQQATIAKSAFLAAMSHEIRTPMNGVIGMLDVLSQSSLRNYQMEMVDLIRESAYSLLGIIDDILDFSKIEADKLELESAPIQVIDVVEKACAMLDHLAEKKGVELTLFTDPAIPAKVLGDEGRLRQLLVNLVNNAIKFSSGQEQPGKVSMRAMLTDDCKAATAPGSLAAFPPSMEVRSGGRATHGAVAERDTDRVVVEIRIADNGIGMDEKTLSGLFTAFTQADASTTRRFGGTGLGLTIVRHLVKLMGGEIVAQSELGKGSTFTIRLPFVPLPAKADTAEAESPVARLSCLVIGELPGMADDVATYLAHGGATVARAQDLTKAREFSGAGSPDLWVWILDATGLPPTLDELRAIAHTRPEQQIRFVVIERGLRRKPRREDTDIVLVDGNVLTQWTVLKAVAIAAGREQEENETPQPGKGETAFSPPSRAEALRQGRLILVAEDNEINQKVILRQLALLGFAADMTDNGLQALERWQSGDYALLLTDLHMPKMDGYALTTAIRTGESGKVLPIIALTANALKGEAEHCRDVGMNDYLSKPVQLVQLKNMLEKWLPAPVKPSPEPPDLTAIPVDVSQLKALVGDDPAVISEFLHEFRISATKTALELKTACENGQAKQVGELAHKLKSSARSVGALALGELCAEMEQAGKAGQVEALTPLLYRFETEIADVDNYLDSLDTTGNIRNEISIWEKNMIEKSHIKITVLDDEPFMLKLLSHMLANLGFIHVTTCDNGRTALESFDNPDNLPDLILLDLNMPEMDGVEFMRHLVERHYTGSLILISGEDERVLQTAEKLVQVHKIQALGHLHKPIHPEALFALLEKWTPPRLGENQALTKVYSADEVLRAIVNGELVNYYQPKVDLVSGKAVGVESLVRWRHPKNGIVFPDHFIGVAEEHGLIDDLTRAVIGEAFAQARAWQDNGLYLHVAINISMDNLATLEFANYVATAASAAGIAPDCIVLEVTESQLMKDVSAPLEILTRLRLKRFGLSIDDFGTGHSSLSQLRDIPFDELKVDQGFVHGAAGNDTLRAIYGVSLGVAKQLNMKTVAEGVEDRTDWDFVHSTGCNLAQGYFIAKPMPAAEIPDWISAWEANFENFMQSPR